MAFPATHAKRDAIVLQTSRGFASAPNSPRVFLHQHHQRAGRQPADYNYDMLLNNNVIGSGTGRRCGHDVIQLMRHADRPGCPSVQATVERICSLFPTAKEYDVSELLAKYHYREAVVVSALQVLKYPMQMPGPATVTANSSGGGNWSVSGRSTTTATFSAGAASPPASRHLNYYAQTGAMNSQTTTSATTMHAWSEIASTSDGGLTCRSHLAAALSTNTTNTPIHSPTPYRPPNSPKIKLKYLKSVFPKADEMFLLDLLVGSDNNVNKVTQQLLTLGHEKRDKPQPLTPRLSVKTATPVVSRRPPERAVKLIPSVVEMVALKKKLHAMFPDEDKSVIQMALESTDFDIETAKIVLTNSQADDDTRQNQQEAWSPVTKLHFSGGIKPTVTLYSLKSSPSVVSTFRDIAALYSPTTELGPDDDRYRCKPRHHQGHAQKGSPTSTDFTARHQGPDDSLLGSNYVAINGPGRLDKGADKTLVGARSTDGASSVSRAVVKGANPANRQGPKVAVSTASSLASFIARKFKRESPRQI